MPRPKSRDAELKKRMLTESIAVLESEGPVAVTARRVATVAGTSTAAVYELYGDKSGLVRSIFFDGFSRLADRLDALPPREKARTDVLGVLDATRGFATDFPMLFEVMFARPFAEFDPSPDDFGAATRIYSLVVERIAAWLGPAKRSQTTVDAAHALVALNQGLISSELSGLLGSTNASVRRRRSLAIEIALDCLEARLARA